ncbi:family 43 glycosylhydrolase [Arthrobacter sp.]|uniref:family 43 glycosylhydrolase n=1 Tax=Arthrobacter sp. TaxID=1667 RepID=UPI0028126615|nr:family 43 glycosylhydrolase [Arthrobacter sp.]
MIRPGVRAALAAFVMVATGHLGIATAHATELSPPSPPSIFLLAFGSNAAGQTAVPESLAKEPLKALAAGNGHTIALSNAGRLSAWGSNVQGQSTVPPIADRKFKAIAAGASHSLALSTDGKVTSWGGNTSGQATVPEAARAGVAAISAGGSNSLALKTDGTLVGWGDNAFAQNQIPASLAGQAIKQISTGAGFNVALTAEGKVTAWGRSDYGQIELPAALGTAKIKAISSGVTHSLALTDTGTVVAWGSNTYGQLNVPAELGSEKVTAIAAGGYHSLVSTESGQIFAWGDNNAAQSTVPAGYGPRIVAMAAGEAHSVVFTRPDDDGAPAAVVLPGSPANGAPLDPANGMTGVITAAVTYGAVPYLAGAALLLSGACLVAFNSRRPRHSRRIVGAALTAAVGAALLVPASPALAEESVPVPKPSLEQLVATNGVLYFANSGATVTDKVAPGDTMGIYQSRSDQAYGPDAKTGGSWGFVSDAFSNPKRNTNSTLGKYDSILYDAPPPGSALSSRAVKYDFALPNGNYDVTFGFKLPGGWAGRTLDLMAEGQILGTAATSGTALEKTFNSVAVTDGILNLQAHSQAGRTNTFHDPALNFIVIRQPLDYTPELLAEKIRQATLTPEQASLYAPDSVAVLGEKLAAAQSLVGAGSADTAANKAAYEAIGAATAGLRKLVTYDSFNPGQPWLDTNGRAIQGHGGQVIPSKDAQGRTIYYWYGEDRTQGYQPMAGLHGYSSYDLYNWKDEGLVLKTAETRAQLDTDPYFTALYADYTTHEKDAVFRDLDSKGVGNAVGRAIVLERPKVMYNESTGKWVLWVHTDGPSTTSNAQYAKATAGVAVSDTPFGPFRYVDSYRLDRIPADNPNNQYPSQPGMARDMNLFKDDDGTGYIIYSSEENRTMYVSRLNSSYMYLNVPWHRSVDGVDFSRNFQGVAREAPAMFKYDGTYYLITSGATGWDPNPARYATSPTPIGPWTQHGSPAVGPGSETTFRTQSTSVIPIDPAAGKFIYMGDRWIPSDLGNSPMVWLPLTFGANGDLSFRWTDRWTVADLENRGKFTVDMAMPASVPLGSGPSALPATAVVSQNGSSTTSAVTWSGADFSVPGSATVTATFASNGRTASYTVMVVPSGLVYFADPGSTDTADYAAIRAAASAAGALSNSAKDQPLGADPGTGKTWGYDNPGTATVGGDNIFGTLRYVTKESARKDVSYLFGDLEAGAYTVYVGLYDPWAQYAPNRAAKISINGTVVDASRRISGTNTTMKYAGHSPDGEGKLKVNLAPTTPDDVQVSWIMVVKG